jgi:outer membrane murein-binding lipoprotein Lpp
MDSRIKELESSISALRNDLEQVKDKEDKAKSSAEEATDLINRYEKEVQGKVWFHMLPFRYLLRK